VTDEPLAEGLEPYVSLQTLPSGDGWKLYSSRAEYVASPVGLSDGWRGGGVGTNGCWNGCGCVAGVDAAAVGKGVALGVARPMPRGEFQWRGEFPGRFPGLPGRGEEGRGAACCCCELNAAPSGWSVFCSYHAAKSSRDQ
jgi:hypothetical protein